jgi:glycine/D-amino acid oxidase-like deaminating enzyme
MEFVKACRFISTEDGLPLIGHGGQSEHVIYAYGFGGNGIVFSTIAAGLIKEKLTGKSVSFPDRYSIDRLITARQER